MGFVDLNLMTSYETGAEQHELLESFYIPVLEQSIKYYRIAGFFSSTSLSIAAKGIEGLINNGGKMYLLVSPVLSQEDYDVIQKYGTLDESSELLSDFYIGDNPDEYLQAMAWLLSMGYLEIKIVVPKRRRSSLFHQKIGIFFDSEDNIVSFSGSINESAQAWLENIEEFKVFKSWISGQNEYLLSDLNKFTNYWNNKRDDIALVFDIPDSIKNQILKIRPRDIHELNIMRRYNQEKNNAANKLSLFPHQKAAVECWKENGYALLMEMATGTGKTRTAIGCMVSKLEDKETLLVIVATPQNTLSRQWNADLEQLGIKLDKTLIVDGSNSKWRKELKLLLYDLNLGIIKTAIVFTTHDTSSKDDFTKILITTKFNTKVLYVCDEVHAAGAHEQQKALLSIYDYRIGLSATPERMYDNVGTELIREYFGGKSYEFTIADALGTINPITNQPFLNRFEYHPIFVSLRDDEIEQYQKYTKQITFLSLLEDRTLDEEERLKTLLLQRAKICKNAFNKNEAFEVLLNKFNPTEIKDTLVFCSDRQIRFIFDTLTKLKIKRAKITENESATKKVNIEGETERQEIISQFKRRELQVLVGIKCLDEGIDIKNARVAIIMSSSTNPREYIQRVGRVIRTGKDKEVSQIFDFIVVPPSIGEGSIIEKEAKRAYLIAKNAINFENVKKEFLEYGVKIDAD